MTIENNPPDGPEPTTRVRKPNVFVSYSHYDKSVLETLLPFLGTLEDDGLVTVWTDRNIQGGQEWRKEIDTALDAATIAVLLISQTFLHSKFVRNEELPRILEQQLAGQMTVLPVFVSPSTVTSASFTVPDAHGNKKAIVLSELQGYGTPSQPLSKLPLPERQEAFVELHDRIRELATGKRVASSLPRIQLAAPKAVIPLAIAMTVAVVIIVLILGLLGWRSIRFRQDVSRFEAGSLASIPQVAAYGDKGMAILIDNLDAAGESNPARTLGILQALHAHPDAVAKHRSILERQAAENRRRIESVTTTIEADQEKGLAITPQQVQHVEQLAHVAVCMNELLKNDPPDWPELALRVRVLLRKLPVCEWPG